MNWHYTASLIEKSSPMMNLDSKEDLDAELYGGLNGSELPRYKSDIIIESLILCRIRGSNKPDDGEVYSYVSK